VTSIAGFKAHNAPIAGSILEARPMRGEGGGSRRGNRKARLGQQSRMENDATIATPLPQVNTGITVHYARFRPFRPVKACGRRKIRLRGERRLSAKDRGWCGCRRRPTPPIFPRQPGISKSRLTTARRGAREMRRDAQNARPELPGEQHRDVKDAKARRYWAERREISRYARNDGG
jgi:hypothetical protein